MKKQYRIKKKSEIDAIFNQRVQKGNAHFTIYVKEEQSNNFKFGMSIGKKYGNAVSRNKIKRQIRSVIRLNKSFIKNNYSFIIVIKPKANTLPYNEIELQILNLLKNLKIMEKYNEK